MTIAGVFVFPFFFFLDGCVEEYERGSCLHSLSAAGNLPECMLGFTAGLPDSANDFALQGFDNEVRMEEKAATPSRANKQLASTDLHSWVETDCLHFNPDKAGSLWSR